MEPLQGTAVARIDGLFRYADDRRRFSKIQLFQVTQHNHFVIVGWQLINDSPHATAQDGHRNLVLTMAMDLSARRKTEIELPASLDELMAAD